MPRLFYFEGEILRIDFLEVVTNQDFNETTAQVEELERRCVP